MLFFKYKIISNFIISKILYLIYNEIDNHNSLYIILRRIKDEEFCNYKLFCKSFYEFKNKRYNIINTFKKK